MSDVTTLTLADFLLEQINLVEQVARQAISGQATHDPEEYASTTGGVLTMNPHLVVAECEAKRLIVGLHSPHREVHGGLGCRICHEYEASEGCWGGGDLWPCDTLAALALPYADHPDYRDEWRP